MKTQKPLPNPPLQYEPEYMYDLASLIIDEEQSTLKVDRDNVITTGSIIFKDELTDGFYRLKVYDGALSITAVPVVGNVPVSAGKNPYVP